MEYCRYDAYNSFFEKARDKKLKNSNPNDLKYMSTDTSIMNNKEGTHCGKHNPQNKNRKGDKVSVVLTGSGNPMIVSTGQSHIHDSNFAKDNIKKLLKNKKIKKCLDKVEGHTYFLADSAYDSNDIKKTLSNNKIKHIIKPNKKNTKDPKKIRRLNKSENRKYRKRIIVEHFFGILKKKC